MFEKLLELRIETIGALLLLLAFIFVVYLISKRKETHLTSRIIVYAGMAISLSFVLSSIRIFRMPQGGTVTPASMLPLLIFAFMFGPVPAILAGIVYGCLQLIQDAYIVHWMQLILDYPLAFAMLGIAGFFSKKRYAGIVIACALRTLCHFISGFVFFSEYAPESQGPVLYSLIYNGSFMLAETVITVLLAIPVIAALKRTGRLDNTV